MPNQLLFLPGASGNIQFWMPISNALTYQAQMIHVGWPGFGSTPPSREVQGLSDLVNLVVQQINQPTALIAQSMGGIVALLAALEKPTLVTHLVLAATSGGIDMSRFGAENWRPSFMKANPSLPPWFANYHEDISHRLREVDIPVLLIWGDADPISPVSTGQYLASLLPNAMLKVFLGGGHDTGNAHAHEIAPLIDGLLID